VVIAIIAILVSLLFPAMSKAKVKAQSITCRNNLKQFQVAWEMYAADHGGKIVPNRIGAPFGYFEGLAGSWALGKAKRDATDEKIRQGVLYDYVSNAGPYRCPSDRSTVQGKPSVRRSRSYSLMSFLNGYYSPGNGSIDPAGNLTLDHLSIAPAKIFAFIDEREDSIESPDFALSNDGAALATDLKTWQWNSLPAERHHNGANLSFLDGHVEWRRWLHTKKRYQGISSYHAVNAKGQEDLSWLAMRTYSYQRFSQ